MTTKIILSLCCLIAFYSISSCTKDDLKRKGDITGKVVVYDSLGRPLSDYSGVQVIIDSTNRSTLTDASGAYVFHRVPAGIYNFSFKKEGYGTYRIIRQQHAGGSQPTRLDTADVGKIYDGPPVTLYTIISLGGPNSTERFTYTEFAAPFRIPAPTVLYISNQPEISSTNFVINIRYTNAFIPEGNMAYQTESFQPYVAVHPILHNSPYLKAVLAFDNVRDIHYIDEEGRTIYPCTGKIFEEPPTSRTGAKVKR
ncbi:carboxypeptidase-like regulatory domain-containing protein [Chitinophaga filiformis]|uniref:carboxypeptidase-like regulatory domain-containing protein n=1 Tax=Chitinophaga filiformis TaxID=104663 RepID=UPI001F1C231A|nr:carboxypeptidase-like regulatory domain-containing protein [Chitinophaga filiformis]MCF6406574.1 carboxypeptidase-like regulatory domain-containing protein [Chitinophaga filiformis]